MGAGQDPGIQGLKGGGVCVEGTGEPETCQGCVLNDDSPFQRCDSGGEARGAWPTDSGQRGWGLLCKTLMDGNRGGTGASVCTLLNRKGKGSGAVWRKVHRRAGFCSVRFQSWACQVPPGKSWVNYLTSLCLRFFICTGPQYPTSPATWPTLESLGARAGSWISPPFPRQPGAQTSEP